MFSARGRAPTPPSSRELQTAKADYLALYDWFKRETEAATKTRKISLLTLYYKLVAYFFPELLKSEYFPMKKDLSLNLWDELHRKVTNLVRLKQPTVKEWAKTTR